MNFPLDNYTIQSRLFPMFILLLPLGLLLLVWFPATSIWVGGLETLGAPVVLTALFSQLGRDLGKKKELTLFALWNGMPTDRILSRTGTILDQSVLVRYRAKLSSLIPNVVFPEAKEEALMPDAALQIFRSCTNFMREKTRDRQRFPLVYAENVNYGFRRNLWAMKPAGMTIAVFGILGSLSPILITPANVNYPVLITSVFLNVCLFVFWILRINRNWVKMPAEEYARQLFAACENL